MENEYELTGREKRILYGIINGLQYTHYTPVVAPKEQLMTLVDLLPVLRSKDKNTLIISSEKKWIILELLQREYNGRWKHVKRKGSLREPAEVDCIEIQHLIHRLSV